MIDLKDQARRAAVNFTSRRQFWREDRINYDIARKNGWLDDVCSHMPPHPQAKWTKESVRVVALKHSERLSFMRNDNKAYQAAERNGWLNDVCAHMKRRGNRSKRLVYEIFDAARKTVYVGLTYCLEQRLQHHRTYGRNGMRDLLGGPHEMIVSGFMPQAEASAFEDCRLKIYAENGWTILNKNRGGALGGSRVWTKDEVNASAKQYKSRAEFKTGNHKAYSAARRYGWLEDACRHMGRKLKHNWTIEQCVEASRKYTRIVDFCNGPDAAAYQAACRYGWREEVCAHMPRQQISWTKEMCAKEAEKYRNRTEFSKRSANAYSAADRNGWLDAVCSHMEFCPNWKHVAPPEPSMHPSRRPKRGRRLTKDMVAKSASRFNRRVDFKRGDRVAYDISRKNGWIDEICNHMPKRCAKL